METNLKKHRPKSGTLNLVFFNTAMYLICKYSPFLLFVFGLKA